MRWAYNSWVEEPLHDTKHVTWSAGDCFLVYPGPRSSIRFERLREGIQDYEKIRILRELVAGSNRAEVLEAVRVLDEALAQSTYELASKAPAAGALRRAKQALLDLAREVAE